MILLVHSELDLAGTNIATHILQNYPFKVTAQTFQETPIYHADLNGKSITFVTLKEESVYTQTLPETFPEAELIVFLSRHSSQSGTPTLTVHTPGNFGAAELGGLPKTVSVSPANAMADALRALNNQKTERQLSYQVSYEATHHGPSLSVPTMFVELGSSEAQWDDKVAAAVVAEAALAAVANFGVSKQPAVLGIGGTHYNQKFTQMALENGVVFSHMIPKYAVSEVTPDLLRHCVQRTFEPVGSAVVDWKGISSKDKSNVLSALQEVGLPFKKV
jgi:D-aminoacyl-tRNA deacylase